MNPLVRLANFLDIRPHEYRTFTVSALGALLVISFIVAARSVRDAFFIDEFTTAWLPHMTLVTTLVSVPMIAYFSRLLVRRPPQLVFRRLVLILVAGLALLQTTAALAEAPWLTLASTAAFYLWTATGGLLLTTGFWVVTSELFVLRDAKRLFGLISAGGTAGAMGAGLSLTPIAALWDNAGLVLGLQLTLIALYVLQGLLPEKRSADSGLPTTDAVSARESMRLVAATPHLRLMATIVAVATIASYVVDYQFKVAAAAMYVGRDEAMAGFFGRFYGVTGAAALLLQVLLASKLLARAGVSWSLSVLPIALVTGATAMLLAPGLAVATIVRGADNSLRRSVHRTVLEYLYVPIPEQVRRRTKAFIDSLVDSGADGVASLTVLLWLALGWSTNRLSLLVVGLAAIFLLLAHRMGKQYFSTLMERLDEGREEIPDGQVLAGFVAGDVTMTVTQFDMNTLLTQSGLAQPVPGATQVRRPSARPTPVPAAELTLLDRLLSQDPRVISAALDEREGWAAQHVEPLVRLLARDAYSGRVSLILGDLGVIALEPLAAVLVDENADFVIRRRIPRTLARIPTVSADEALVAGLEARRFEVRYRCAVALARRRKRKLPESPDQAEKVWAALRAEISHERPIWELQRLLDDRPAGDDFVSDRVYGRGELSLEHTFRLLSLVVEPQSTRTAFYGIVMDDERLRSISLEYLDQVLPADVREHLWPFIGDISDYHRRRDSREMGAVVSDLLKTGATLFGTPLEQDRLREALKAADEEDADSEDEPS